MFIFVLLLDLLLLIFQNIDGVLEQSHTLFVLSRQELLHDSVWRFVLAQVEHYRFFVAHWLLFLLIVALHKFVNLDTLKGTHLPNVVFQSGVATSDANHDLVGLDHESVRDSAHHIFALVVLGLLFKL